MNIQQLLTQYGLTNNEAIIYEALTKLTEASAYTLSKETNIPKTSIYEILDNLKDKGLVSKSIVNSSSYFTTESPNRFLTNATEKVDIARMIIPEIENIVQIKNKISASVKFYTGEEGVKKVFAGGHIKVHFLDYFFPFEPVRHNSQYKRAFFLS